MLTLDLPASLATSLASGHPWVYRDHVGNFTAPAGSWVRVRSGSFSAVGLWDAESAIALRIFSTETEVDDAWIERRVLDAWRLREALREQGITGYRLIFGEGDGLPGVVVDLYGKCAILVTYSKSLGKLCVPIALAVQKVAGCDAVVRKRKEGERTLLQPLVGEVPTDEIQVVEHGMILRSNPALGQKTGLFFDHRENRRYVRGLARGKRVLNLFSYTGGFSVAAALGGAVHVTSVDIAAGAVRASEQNLVENGCDPSAHRAVVADVFDYLEGIVAEGERFDLVICDPPSFAKNRAQLKAAEKAYRRLFALVFRAVEPGGTLCAASCTSQIGPHAFRLALADAARKARVRFAICHDVGHPLDHPVLVGHEEGRYLKFVAGRVDVRV